MPLYKNHKFADESKIEGILFSSELPGNVWGLSSDRPRSIAGKNWSRFKPICHFIKTHNLLKLASAI
jgi:hypothetical protein